MKLSKELEKMLIELNLKTNIDVVIANEKEIIDYIGDINKSMVYINQPLTFNAQNYKEQCLEIISNEKNIKIYPGDTQDYKEKTIYRFLKDNIIMMFTKQSSFTDEDILLLRLTLEFIEKYFI